MYLQLVPNIRLKMQEGDSLWFVRGKEDEFLEVPGLKSFDVSRLQRPVLQSQLPLDAVQKLLNEKVCEVVFQNTVDLPEGLSFLSLLTRSEEELKRQIQRLKENEIALLHLGEREVSFNEIGQRVQAHQFKSVSAIQEFIDARNDFPGWVVVTTDSFDSQEILALNKYLLMRNLSWLLITQNHLGTMLGPFFDNDELQKHHCYSCFLARFKSAKEIRYLEDFGAPQLLLPPHVGSSLEVKWAEWEILKIHLGFSSKYEKQLQLFDSLNSAILTFNYQPSPLCEVCAK